MRCALARARAPVHTGRPGVSTAWPLSPSTRKRLRGVRKKKKHHVHRCLVFAEYSSTIRRKIDLFTRGVERGPKQGLRKSPFFLFFTRLVLSGSAAFHACSPIALLPCTGLIHVFFINRTIEIIVPTVTQLNNTLLERKRRSFREGT